MLMYKIKTHTTGKDIYCLPYKNLKNKNLRGMNLTCADMRNMDLSGSDLSGCNLTKADLRGANLTGCNLTGCYILGCKFDDAIMINVRGLDTIKKKFMDTSGFYHASWSGCDFYGVYFDWLDTSATGNISKFFERCKNVNI